LDGAAVVAVAVAPAATIAGAVSMIGSGEGAAASAVDAQALNTVAKIKKMETRAIENLFFITSSELAGRMEITGYLRQY
jgi:hypothetical protein